MKILFLSDDFPPRSFGGAGISTFELARTLKAKGYDISVITTCRDKALSGEVDYEGLKVFKIHAMYHERWRAYKSLNNRRVVKQIEEILKRVKPDVVHANNIHQFISYRALKVAKKYAKVIWTARDTMAITYGKLNTKRYLEKLDSHVSWLDNLKLAKLRWNPIRNILIRYYLGYADVKVAISNSLKEALEVNGIKDVRVVYNGIDIEEWNKPIDSEDFKNKHGLDGKKIILFGGRLSPSKGGDKAIEAMAKVVKKVPQAVLLCIGAVDEYAKEMEKKAIKLGIRENLLCIGWLDRNEIKEAYLAADVVLVPSLYLDPFGRVNIEAMAAKKPVVGTCFGGTPEIVVDNKSGYIISPFDIGKMSKSLIDLLENQEKAKQFGEAGYEIVKSKFNLKDKVNQMVNYFIDQGEFSGSS